jgi:DNA-binding transcriptional regulator YiaG
MPMPRVKPLSSTALTSQAMTGAEFKVIRECLGLPAAWVARQLGTFERTLSRWETGAHPVRADAEKLLRQVESETRSIVAKFVTRIKPGTILCTYRYDESVQFTSKYGWEYPASWHRAMVGQVASMLDGEHRIVYDD